MTNEQLHELAAPGVTQRIHAIEAELASYHKEWPELFLTAPPRLLKAGTPSSNGNGHRPAAPPIVAPAAGDGRTSSWTPERRAKHARAIRRALRARKTASSTSRPMKAATKRKLSLAMKRRHASGELARARAKAAKARAAANG
jgi:hypothetical protein